MFDSSHHKMFAEPAAMIANYTPEGTFDQVLSRHPASNMESGDVQTLEEIQKARTPPAAAGETPKSATSGSRAASARNRPSNQHGSRATSKTTNDAREYARKHGLVDCDEWLSKVQRRYEMLDGSVEFALLADTLRHQLT